MPNAPARLGDGSLALVQEPVSYAEKAGESVERDVRPDQAKLPRRFGMEVPCPPLPWQRVGFNPVSIV